MKDKKMWRRLKLYDNLFTYCQLKSTVIFFIKYCGICSMLMFDKYQPFFFLQVKAAAINTVIKENQQNSIFLRADNLFKAKLVGDA